MPRSTGQLKPPRASVWVECDAYEACAGLGGGGGGGGGPRHGDAAQMRIARWFGWLRAAPPQGTLPSMEKRG